MIKQASVWVKICSKSLTESDFNSTRIGKRPNALSEPVPPDNFELMKSLAAKLSAGIPQVRVDFYEIGGKVYFGEYTFYHWRGLVPFEPDKWDFKLGELWKE